MRSNSDWPLDRDLVQVFAVDFCVMLGYPDNVESNSFIEWQGAADLLGEHIAARLEGKAAMFGQNSLGGCSPLGTGCIHRRLIRDFGDRPCPYMDAQD